MKLLRGKANRILQPFIGRVRSVKTDARGASHLIASAADSENFVLLRTGFPVPGAFTHPSLLLDVPLIFAEGDVLRLDPDGSCLRLYEQQADDNALVLTEECNSRCIMCPQPPKKANSNRICEAIDIISAINPSPVSLGITGGEPTCAFDDLLCILYNIRTLHPNCYIQLLTNARLLTDFSMAKALHSVMGRRAILCIPVYSEVETVHDALVGANGAWGQTLNGIANLARLRAAVEIRTLVLRQNYERLPQWSEFIYRNAPFAAHVAIMGPEPIGFAAQHWETLRVDPRQSEQALTAAVRALHRRDMPVSLYNMQLCMLPRTLWRFATQSISGWKVRYPETCDLCTVKDKCGGFFFSALRIPGGCGTPAPIPREAYHESAS